MQSCFGREPVEMLAAMRYYRGVRTISDSGLGRSGARFIAAGLCLVALASTSACSLTEPPRQSPEQTAAVSPAQPPPVAVPVAPEGRPQPVARPAPEPFPMQLDPGILIGLAPEQVEVMMGQAIATREEPPASVWVYRSGECALEVFFYPEVATKKPRALAYTVGGKDQSDAAKQECFARIRMARHDRQH
jgi:hypothetical protein